MATLKLRTIGNSVGALFPRDVLARLGAQAGDELHVVEAKDGIFLTTFDPAVAEQLEAGREVMRQYRDTLRILSK